MDDDGSVGEEVAPEGKLPPDLVFRLRAGHLFGGVSSEDLAMLGSCLESDPRTKVLILRALEFTGPHLFYPDPERLMGLAIREGVSPDIIRFYLRNVAYWETGEEGASATAALALLDELGETQARRWLGLRAAHLRRFDFRSWPSDHFGDSLASRSWEWVARQSWCDPSLVGTVVAEGKWYSRAAPDVVAALASQTSMDLEEFDLGLLEEPVCEARVLVEGIADPLERARRIAVKVSDQYHFGPFFSGKLSGRDIEILRLVADDRNHKLRGDAARRLADEAANFEEAREWLEARFRSSEEKEYWDWILVWSTDRDLIAIAVDRMLKDLKKDSRVELISFGITRLCRMPGKLPGPEVVALIRRALEKDYRGVERSMIWRSMVEDYGDQVADFRDLLGEARLDESTSIGHYTFDLLLQRGLYREEISAIIEERMDRYLQAGPSSGMYSPPWGLLRLAGSSRTVEIWLRLARGEGDEWTQEQAIGALVSYYADRVEVRQFLLEKARSDNSYLRSHVARLLAVRLPGDREVEECLGGDRNSWFPMGLADLPDGFDEEGFRKWEENADHRFERRLQEVCKGRERGDRERSLFSLLYWFGDRPETLPFLASFIFLSQEKQDELKARTERSFARPSWSEEREFRAYCVKIIGFRWPKDKCVHDLAKEAMDHPWREIRREAARILSREYAESPDTPGRIAKHIGKDAITFGEYTALMAGKPDGMRVALEVLRGEIDDEELGHDAPLYLVAHFGPRKDLRQAFGEIAAQTSSRQLKLGIEAVLAKFWS